MRATRSDIVYLGKGRFALVRRAHVPSNHALHSRWSHWGPETHLIRWRGKWPMQQMHCVTCWCQLFVSAQCCTVSGTCKFCHCRVSPTVYLSPKCLSGVKWCQSRNLTYLISSWSFPTPTKATKATNTHHFLHISMIFNQTLPFDLTSAVFQFLVVILLTNQCHLLDNLRALRARAYRSPKRFLVSHHQPQYSLNYCSQLTLKPHRIRQIWALMTDLPPPSEAALSSERH